jgi:hypothetical protein
MGFGKKKKNAAMQNCVTWDLSAELVFAQVLVLICGVLLHPEVISLRKKKKKKE